MSIFEKSIVREESGIPMNGLQSNISTPEEQEIIQLKFEHFCKQIRWILFLIYIPVILSGIGIIILIVNFISGAAPFEGAGLHRFLELAEISILFGMASVGLRSIRTARKPFTKTMSFCIMTIGIIVLLYSALMPSLFPQLRSGYDLLSFGRFCIDGFYCAIGVLIILFSRIYHYGVELQKSDDLTI